MNCKWTLEVVGYREENPSGLKKFYPGTHYFQSREEVEEFTNESTKPTGNNKFWEDGISKMVYRVVPFQETAA